jgi:hypothetical protein
MEQSCDVAAGILLFTSRCVSVYIFNVASLYTRYCNGGRQGASNAEKKNIEGRWFGCVHCPSGWQGKLRNHTYENIQGARTGAVLEASSHAGLSKAQRPGMARTSE